MDLFPAIDLKDGACVRLRQGDFAEATLYDADPFAVVARFAQAGAKWLHLVDLDGAKNAAARQTDLIARLVRETKLAVQTGGGVRSQDDIEALLATGVQRVVIGSVAVQAPGLVWNWLKLFGSERIVLALDVRLDEAENPEVLTHGWQERSGASLWAVLKAFDGSGLRTVLCTDIGRDGMMKGPNVELYRRIQTNAPALELIASGGISSLADIRALAELKLAGAITGKALYEGAFTLADAIKEAAHAR